MDDYLKLANSPTMWVACAIPVLLIAFQAVIFVGKSLRTAKKIGITQRQLRNAVTSSTISSFGPSVVVAVGALGLILAVGAPVSWFRLSYIGAVQFELSAANFGARAAGAAIDAMTPISFANAVWVMTIASIGWLVMTVVFAKRFDKLTKVVAGNNDRILGVISIGAMLGCFANLSASRLVYLDTGALAVTVGFASMCILLIVAKKTGKKWVSDWSLTFAMLIGMLATIPLTMMGY